MITGPRNDLILSQFNDNWKRVILNSNMWLFKRKFVSDYLSLYTYAFESIISFELLVSNIEMYETAIFKKYEK